jgi:hypothetical protein
MILIANYEDHPLRALADTGTIIRIILDAFTSALFIKIDYKIQPPGLQGVVNLLQLNLGL